MKQPGERALTWLSRGLFEGLEAYIGQAKPGEYLYGCFYEFKEDRTLTLLKEAKKRGVNVLLIADGKQYGEENLEAVRRIGITRLVKSGGQKRRSLIINSWCAAVGRTGKRYGCGQDPPIFPRKEFSGSAIPGILWPTQPLRINT